MTEYKVVSGRPEDFADGRVRAAGETIDLRAEEEAEPHNQRLIADGRVISVERPAPARSRSRHKKQEEDK